MSDPMREQFALAVKEVARLPRRPDNMTRLRLYALYQQATLGDCHGLRPGMDDPEGRFKYDAWKALEGLDSADAMEEYIDFVEELKVTYNLT